MHNTLDIDIMHVTYFKPPAVRPVSACSVPQRESNPPHHEQYQMDDPYNPSRMDEFIPYRINVLYRLMTRMGTRVMADMHDLSLAEWWTLVQLVNETAHTVSQLSERTHVDKAQTSRAADALIRKGLASRRPDPDDRRSTLYEATQAGRERFQAALPDRLSMHRAMVAELGVEDTRTFMRATNKLIEFLDTRAGAMLDQRASALDAAGTSGSAATEEQVG